MYKFSKNGQVWFENEHRQLHRDDGLPAVILENEFKQWWVRGQMFRENGLPTMEWEDGTLEWFNIDGKRNRENNMPAVVADDCSEWWVNGRLHRDDGRPAVVMKRYVAYYEHGKRVYPKYPKMDMPDSMIGKTCVITFAEIHDEMSVMQCVTCMCVCDANALQEWFNTSKEEFCPHCRSGWTNKTVYDRFKN